MSNWIKVLLSAAFPFGVFLAINMVSTRRHDFGSESPEVYKALFIAALFYMYVIMPAVSFFGVKQWKFDKHNATLAFAGIVIIPMICVVLYIITTCFRFMSEYWVFAYPYLVFHFFCFIYDTSPSFFQNVRFIYLVSSASKDRINIYGVPDSGIYYSCGHRYVNGVRFDPYTRYYESFPLIV